MYRLQCRPHQTACLPTIKPLLPSIRAPDAPAAKDLEFKKFIEPERKQFEKLLVDFRKLGCAKFSCIEECTQHMKLILEQIPKPEQYRWGHMGYNKQERMQNNLYMELKNERLKFKAQFTELGRKRYESARGKYIESRLGQTNDMNQLIFKSQCHFTDTFFFT